MASPINQVKRHFNDIGIKTVEVPEWADDDGNPMIIYYKPLTVKAKDKLAGLNKDYGNTIEWLVMVLINHALDGQGDHLFTLEDKVSFVNYADVRVVERVAATILTDATNFDEQKKN